jgi:hypothetical protein
MPILFISAATTLLASFFMQQAQGHAVMIEPVSRPWIDYLEHDNYLPHQVFAGGTMAISENESLKWPNMVRGSICGDKVGETKWMTPGPVNTTYKAGAIIDTDIIFAQNHLGRYFVRLCPLDATDEATQCQDLQRADGKGRAVDLPWTPGWHGVTPGYIAPLEIDGFSLYQMPPVGKAEGCKEWACDEFKDMWVYRTQWQLPAKFTCEHCMLQFFYQTGSRCWPDCLEDSKGPCKPNPTEYHRCGEDGASYPELFWNCADIAITK